MAAGRGGFGDRDADQGAGNAALGRARRRLLLLAVLAATALGTMPDRTVAANVDWITGTSGKWSTAADWSGGKSPTSANNVVIESGGTCTVTGSQQASSLILGDNDSSYAGAGTFSLSSTADVSITNGLQFGPASGTIQNGTLDIAPSAVLSLGGAITVGASVGAATINLSGGELNLGGNNIAPGINFNFSGGTLQNVSAENANLNFSGGTVYTTNPTSTFNGAFTGTGGTLTTLGAGVLILASTSGTSDLSLSIGPGSTVQLHGANQISNTGSVTLGGGTLDLNTYGAAVSSLSGSGTIDTVAGGSPALTVGYNNASSTFSGTIQNSAGALVLLKTGSGTLDLSGATTYTGATTISGGALVLDHGAGNSGSLGATAVSVSGGAALVVKGNTSIAQGGGLNVAGGTSPATQGLIDLRDGTINTFTVNGNLSLGSASGGSVLDFEIGGNGVDQISAASVALSGTSTINLSSLGSVPSGNSYPLITVSGGTLNASKFQLGVEPGGFATFGLSTAANNTELVLNITANPTPGTAYWTGKGSFLTSDSANYWGGGGTSGSTNWGQNPDGSNDPLQIPGTTTNVIFAATNVAGSGALSTTLDHNYVIQSLTFAVPASIAITGVTVNTAANSLAIGSGGLTLSEISSSGGTIGGAGGVIVGGSQSWANNSNSANLTVSTPITAALGPTTLTLNGTGTGGVTLSGGIANGNGGPLALSFSQAGATLLSGSNTYSGGTTLSAGILQLGNTAALPAGQAVTVNGGVLDLNGFSPSVGALNGSAGTIQSSGAAATLTTGAGGASSAFYGTIQNGSGSVALTIGGGTLALYGNNTYMGGTSLTAGELAIGGSGAGQRHTEPRRRHAGHSGRIANAGQCSRNDQRGAGLRYDQRQSHVHRRPFGRQRRHFPSPLQQVRTRQFDLPQQHGHARRRPGGL